MRIAADERCSVSLAQLRHDHAIADVLDYVEWLEWQDACAQDEAEAQESNDGA